MSKSIANHVPFYEGHLCEAKELAALLTGIHLAATKKKIGLSENRTPDHS